MRIPLRAVLRLALAASFGLAGMSVMAARSRAAVAPENALPKSTIFFAKVKDAAALRAAFGKTSFGQLLADPGMRDFESDFKEKLAEASKQVKEKVGVTIDELLTLPQGTVAFAVVGKDGGKIPVAILIQADAGTNAAKMTEVMTKATKLAEANHGAKVSTETYKDLTLHVISSGKENDPPLIWTSIGSVFHIATDAEALKDLISHADGREDSLAKNENFAKVSGKLEAAGDASWFLDISKLIELGVKAAAAGGGGQNPDAMLQILGLKGLKAAGGTIAFNTGSYDTLTKTFVLSPGPAQGILKIFSMPKANLRPEPWVPASAATYQTLSWDLDGAYNAINDLANTFQPGLLDVFQQQLVGPNGGEPLSFQKDIFGPLGDRITIVSDYKKPVKEDSQRILFAIALEDAKKFQSTLGKIIAMTNAKHDKREFQGTTIYDFTLPEMPNQPPNSPLKGGKVSVAIAKDYAFLALDPTLLEQVLRGGPGLAENPEFLRISKDLPSQSSSLSFAKADEPARASYESVKSGSFEKAFQQGQPGAPDMSKIAKLFNKDKLPDFSVIAKYLTQGGGFGVMDDDGMLFTGFNLRKAANP